MEQPHEDQPVDRSTRQRRPVATVNQVGTVLALALVIFLIIGFAISRGSFG